MTGINPAGAHAAARGNRSEDLVVAKVINAFLDQGQGDPHQSG
jgi:hypothetical protein